MTIETTPQPRRTVGWRAPTPHPAWCDPRVCEADANGSFSHRSAGRPVEPVPVGEDAWTVWLIEAAVEPHPEAMVAMRAERRWPATGEITAAETYCLELDEVEDLVAKLTELVAAARRAAGSEGGRAAA